MIEIVHLTKKIYFGAFYALGSNLNLVHTKTMHGSMQYTKSNY